MNKQLQEILNSIEAEANKLGFGMFESNFDEEGERGEIHLMPMNRMGLSVGNHGAHSKCPCNPKLTREEPVRIYLHNKVEI